MSDTALVLAPVGRDASVAGDILGEAGITPHPLPDLEALARDLGPEVGFVLVTEEALLNGDIRALARWIEDQPEWSDLPFVLLTRRGGGLERNPDAARFLDALGNVTFLERPFHPTTLVSLARSALRARHRQYEARARLEALQESEDHYRHTVELNPQVTWTALPDGQLDHVAKRWADWTGTTGLGATWGDAMHPDDLDASMRAWAQSCATGEPYDIEHRVHLRSGEYHWMHSRALPRRDAAGRIVKWYGTTEDIQERKIAEARLRASQEALERANETLEARVDERTREREAALAKLHEAQKLETLGQLTGGVAHDFNNLLTPVIGSFDLLGRRVAPDDDTSHRLINGGMQAASRAATLVQRLLAFARRQDLQPRAVDIAALLDGMSDLVRRSLGPTVSIEIGSAPELPAARVDPNQLELAILNLAINGRDAMPGGGRLRIEAMPSEDGRFVRILVEDSGVGMDTATLARAVEPFFSTKGVGKGTGLGLSMVHGLAAQLGGRLALDSAPGAGTRATIWLPVATDAAATTEVEARPLVVAARRATILLVDDEELVRAGTADMLSDIGYEVVQAASGAEAMRLLRSGMRPDLLVTDYLMPGMSGVDLAEAARQLMSDLRVLLITGYSTIAEGRGSALPRLAKPFRQADLAQHVADLLAPSPSRVLPFVRSQA